MADGEERWLRLLRWIEHKLMLVPCALVLRSHFTPTEPEFSAAVGIGWRRMEIKEIGRFVGAGLVVLAGSDDGSYVKPLAASIWQCERENRGELRWSARLAVMHSDDDQESAL